MSILKEFDQAIALKGYQIISWISVLQYLIQTRTSEQFLNDI